MAQILKNQQNLCTIDKVNIVCYMKGAIQAPKGFTVLNEGRKVGGKMRN